MAEKTVQEQCNEEMSLLQLAVLKRLRLSIEGNVTGALGQLLLQQGSQQDEQQQASQQQLDTQQALADLLSKAQGIVSGTTETQHIADINTIERIKAAVARGVSNDEHVNHRINSAGAGMVEIISAALGMNTLTAGLANGQMGANIPDHGAKNSNFGRGMGVFGLLAVGDAVEESAEDTDK